jgi:hypothetical protein
MKAYTDIEQARKLAEFLPLESADMHYWKRTWKENDYAISVGHSKELQEGFESQCIEYIPCWSLAALRACLPPGISIDGILYVFESHNTFDNEWVYEYKFEDISAPLYSKSSNEIDAAVDMIIQLKENKMI